MSLHCRLVAKYEGKKLEIIETGDEYADFLSCLAGEYWVLVV